MGDQQNTIILILDPDFGEEASLLSLPHHIWIIDTPANRTLAENHWHQAAESQTKSRMTTFKSSAGESAEQNCLGILDTIDLHHGGYSSKPHYSAIEVIGLRLLSKVKAALEQFGFEEFVETDGGFRAERRNIMAEGQDH
jgi:hypothetical protein